jgi:hypothetical protein
MIGVQWVGAVVIAAGIVWVFLHPKEAGAGEVGFRGLSAKGLTQGGVIVAVGAVLLIAPLFADDDGDDAGGGTAATATPVADVCHVGGVVYERDSRQPFPGVDVGLVPPGSSFTDEEAFEEAATTDPAGRFDFDCSALLDAGQTAVLALSHPGWAGCIDVVERPVKATTDDGHVTIYVSNKVEETLGHVFGVPRNDNCERPTPDAGQAAG